MGAVQYAAAVLADSPRAYWKLQEASGLPQDSSGNGFNMTATNGTPDYQQSGPVAGVFGIQYASGESHFQSPAISTAVNNFSYEAWISVVTVGANDQEWLRNGNPSFDGTSLLLDTNGSFQAVANGAGLLSNSVVLLGATYSHVVVIRRAGTWEYYFNGNVDTANAGTTAPSPATASSLVGSTGNATVVLAHAAIYDSALSSVRVSAHYQAMLAQDSVVGQYVTTMTGKGNAW